MSWNVKWTVPFKSVLENSYTVKILVDGYEGDAIPLRASTSPFETNENRSDNRFTPIRSQTGYIRIVDNGFDLDGNAFDWQELLPNTNVEHQVRLVDSSDNTIWIGYMKADMYTTQIFEEAIEYEFPILCPLALLEDMQLEFTSNDMKNNGTIGQAIHMIMGKTGVNWQYVDVCANVANYADLNARFNYMNYTKVDPTVNSVTEVATWTDPGARMADILEEFCKFWGWTIQTRGLVIYITANDDTHYFRRFTFSSMANVLSSESSIYQSDEIDIDELTYVSTRHNIDYILGKNNVTITSDVSEVSKVIDPAFKELQYDWYGGTGHIIEYWHNDEYVLYYAIQFYLSNTTTHTEFLHQLRLRFNPVYLGAGRPADIILSLDDYWARRDEDEKYDISLKQNIQVLTGGDTPQPIPAQYMLAMKTLYTVFLPEDVMICINAKARHSLDPRVNYTFSKTRDYVRMYAKIGDKYWDESTNTWSTTASAFKVYINDDAEINTTKPSLLDPHPGAKGFCITMDESLYGQLEIAVLKDPYTDIILSNFEVKVVPKDDMVFPINKGSQKYNGVASPNFKENEDVGLSLISGEHNDFGNGQLYAEDGYYLTTVSFYNAAHTTTTDQVPELHLLSRYQSVYGEIQNRMELEVRPTSTNILPTSVFTHWSDNTRKFVPQAIQRDWGDESIKLTIIEL